MDLNDQKMTRREALAALGALALAGGTAFAAQGAKTAAPAKSMKGIALQLYTMRDPAKADLDGTLKKCREMGWEYVQWSGMPNLPADKIKAALDTAGLKAIAAHISVEPFEKDFAANVKFWKTVGVTDLAPGGMMNDSKANLEAWVKGAKRLDALGAKLREEGIRFSYHNHYFEFEKFPGDPRRKLDIIMETAKAENLKDELDVAWALEGGVDPVEYIRKYKNRCPVIHAKDIIPKKNGKAAQLTALGRGEINWKELFKAGEESGIEWYVYEQDNGKEGTPFDMAKISYDYLKKNLL